ncbi:hypothetical protein TVAG_374900 [Trichomonas vaginalis G3]|uniref:DUF3447 domain-containing protein n=1 Tax=Trichomonas vaginalis (strain ATCC PRA-98 / G3) TaxID=412133 RepID=A2GD69_TRIV3|nr:protein ubiquitination [Trichomonas vaginalis G3]EAX84897.1 hypothetical protein TVAG_374900 [Trichomonas vaginalis G3]KAI5484469.1 protein ubiquitination [Trichomonas vaginalis G3]|eukprot:XP_001297827.1 hypothetical protein [Trichomonas vaginalis G3]
MGKDIVYEDLKIKNFNDVVIPEPFQLLYEAETHYFNLNSENFEESIKFFEHFIKDGPGETQEDNFKYLLELFKDGNLLKRYSDNLHFRMLQTLNNIFKPTIKARNSRFYRTAACAGINVELPPKLAEWNEKPEIKEHVPPGKLDQILIDDDVSKFQQFYDDYELKSSFLNSNRIFHKPSINIIKYLLISNEFDKHFHDEPKSKKLISKSAISAGNLEIIRLFEQKGIKYDNRLSNAFESRNPDLINWLLENYQQENVNYVMLSNIKSIIFCLENHISNSYYNIIEIYYESKFKSILEYMTQFNLPIQQALIRFNPGRTDDLVSIISDSLINKRFDYFNILYDLGLTYSYNCVFKHPISYLIYHDVSDLDLYEKAYQIAKRCTGSLFELIGYVVPKVLQNMDLLKFFLERKIFTPMLKDILNSCGLEEMQYIFDNFQSFDIKEFDKIFSKDDNYSCKPELVYFIVQNYQVKLVVGYDGFCDFFCYIYI